jgi:hypothetical protein
VALLSVVAVLLLTQPLQPGSPSQAATYVGQFGSFHLAVLIGTGLFASGTLVYLAATLKNRAYLALAAAFLLTTGGLRMMRGQLAHVILGIGLVDAAYYVFYVVFTRLMQE